MLSEAEICKSYREAKDKNKQIEILSDLCLCDKQEIIDILVKNNQIPGIKPPDELKRKEKYFFTPEEVEQIEKMYAERVSARDIAEKLGLDELSVINKIKRMKLPSKYNRGRTKSKNLQPHSDTDAAYIKELEKLLKEKDDELKAVKEENAHFALLNRQLMESTKDMGDSAEALRDIERKYGILVDEYKSLKSKCRCGTVEVINDLELLTVLFASLKERLPDELLERITVRIEGMTAFLRREVDFVE